MSLLTEQMESCVILNKQTSPDGYGGYKTEWKVGADISAAAVKDTSMEARIADKQGVTALYTITTRKNINLQYNDIIRRSRDGKLFKIKSDGDDSATPNSAGLDMRQVTAEEIDSLPR